MRLRIGKFCGAGNDPKGNSETIAPPEAQYLVGKLLIFLGISDVDPGSPDRHRLAVSVQRSAMGGGINAARHSTNYDEPAGSQVAGQPLGDAHSIGRWVPGPNHCDRRICERFRISSNVENERRVVNLQQSCWDIG